AGDERAGVGGEAAHGGDQAGLGAALGLVVRPVAANRVDQVVPFELVRVWLVRPGAPGDVAIGWAVVLGAEDAAAGRRVAVGRDDRRAARAVGVAGELLMAAAHAAAFEEHFGAVAER